MVGDMVEMYITSVRPSLSLAGLQRSTMYKPSESEPWEHLLHECTDAILAFMRDFRGTGSIDVIMRRRGVGADGQYRPLIKISASIAYDLSDDNDSSELLVKILDKVQDDLSGILEGETVKTLSCPVCSQSNGGVHYIDSGGGVGQFHTKHGLRYGVRARKVVIHAK
jgi:hypothetical protein